MTLIRFFSFSSLISISLACSDQGFLNNIELPSFPQKEETQQDGEQTQSPQESRSTQKRKDLEPPTSTANGSGYMDEQEGEDTATDSDNKGDIGTNETEDSEVIITNNSDTNASHDADASKNSVNAEKEEKPTPRQIKSMALLGDSIGVGMVSGSQFGNLSFSNQVLNNIGYDLIQGSFNIESYDAYFKENGYNPFTSQKLKSLAVNLGLDESKTQNIAVSGSRIYQMNAQISQMQKSDLVVLEVGSNDICASDHDVKDFLREYENVLTELKNQEHKPTVLVVPAFPVHKLHRFKSHYLFGNLGPFGNSPTCQDSYALMCGTLVNSSEKDILDRYNGINNGIESLVEKLDPQNEQLLVAPRLDSFTMKPSYLAMDCFHPNYNFNQYYSDIIWNELGPEFVEEQK